MTKTAILGGSFDPVHLGHLFLLHNAVISTDYSRFILIPAKVSNFKIDARPVSSDKDRLEMLKLAIEDYHELYPQDKKEIIVSDIELKRGGVSYTYDTVIELKNRYGINERLGLIMGDDHIASLSKWYRYDELKNEVQFIICPRSHLEDFDNIPRGLSYVVLKTETVKAENATDVRSNIDAYSNYLSRRVLDYVREHNLYS